MKRSGSGGRFLDQRSVLLCHLVHLHDGLVDLFDARGLFLAGRRNLGHDIGHPLDAVDNFIHRLAGLGHLFAALFDFVHRIPDQCLDLLGRRCRALRKISDLRRHHCKAAPLLAGTRRLDCRIERQNIGLKSNAVDHADDVDDLSGRRIDGAHGADHFSDDAAAAQRDAGSGYCQLVGLTGIVGILFNRRRQLLHRGGCFFERSGLLFSATGEVKITGRDLSRRRRDRVGAIAHFADDPHQAVIHVLQGLHQLTGLVAGLYVNATRQITAGHGLRQFDCQMQLPGDAHRQPPRQHATQGHRNDGEANQIHLPGPVQGFDRACGMVNLANLVSQLGSDRLFVSVQRRYQLGVGQFCGLCHLTLTLQLQCKISHIDIQSPFGQTIFIESFLFRCL